jgi:hypothetical protein
MIVDVKKENFITSFLVVIWKDALYVKVSFCLVTVIKLR